MECVIVDYGSGNVRSAMRALAQVSQGHNVVLSDDPCTIARADYLVLPGVGAFGNCQQALEARAGVIEAMGEHVYQRQRPFLGICVGMQMLADFGWEHEVCTGLGWIPGRVAPFSPEKVRNLTIPHMGWNRLQVKRDHPLMQGIPSESMVYFVHSFVFHPEDSEDVWVEAEYGERFAAIVGRDNIMGTQFHPEKSQHVGLALLKNFLSWRP